MPAGGDPSPWSALALFGQLGLVMVVSTLLGLGAGLKLGDWAGRRGAFAVVGVLLGVGAGAAGVYRLLAKETGWKC